jgi:hypothetical protein
MSNELKATMEDYSILSNILMGCYYDYTAEINIR